MSWKIKHELSNVFIHIIYSKLEDMATPILPLLMDIVRTPAVWVDMCGDLANGWGLYTLLTEGPTYMNDVLHFDISSVRYASSYVSLA